MPAKPAILKFSQPVRDVKLVRSGESETLRREDLEAAYERGRLDGERSVSEQLIRQRSAVVDLQNGVLTSLRNVVPQVIRDTENALVELAFEVAKKIVSGVPIDAAMVQASVQEAIAQAADTAELIVQVHPADFAMLQASQSPLLNGPENKNLRFVPTAQVSRGGCVVQTCFGVIDARRETRVELIRNTLQIASRDEGPAEAGNEPGRGRPVPADPVGPRRSHPIQGPEARPSAEVATSGETVSAGRAATNPGLVAPANPEPVRKTEPQAEQNILQP